MSDLEEFRIKYETENISKLTGVLLISIIRLHGEETAVKWTYIADIIPERITELHLIQE